MNIHEYQAKQILARFGVPVPKGQPASTPDEVASAFKSLGQTKAVVKVQIHAGGRGKAGGVKVVSSADEARDFAAKLLGKQLVTHQTGPEGRVVRRMYVEEASEVARELYLGLRRRSQGAARSPSSPAPKAGWISKRSRPRRPSAS